VFLADAAGFLLLGWALDRWSGDPVDWGRNTGIALTMGFVTADLARRLAGVEAGEVRSGFSAYRTPTQWILIFWALLLGALAFSFAAVSWLG